MDGGKPVYEGGRSRPKFGLLRHATLGRCRDTRPGRLARVRTVGMSRDKFLELVLETRDRAGTSSARFGLRPADEADGVPREPYSERDEHHRRHMAERRIQPEVRIATGVSRLRSDRGCSAESNRGLD
jgi:hypothetical protein